CDCKSTAQEPLPLAPHLRIDLVQRHNGACGQQSPFIIKIRRSYRHFHLSQIAFAIMGPLGRREDLGGEKTKTFRFGASKQRKKCHKKAQKGRSLAGCFVPYAPRGTFCGTFRARRSSSTSIVSRTRL